MVLNRLIHFKTMKVNLCLIISFSCKLRNLSPSISEHIKLEKTARIKTSTLFDCLTPAGHTHDAINLSLLPDFDPDRAVVGFKNAL